MSSPGFKITAFILLTALFSSFFYALIIEAGSLSANSGLYVLGLMWAPGAAAIVVRLVTQRNLRGQGWALGPVSHLFLSYVLPILYAAPVYALVWGFAFGGLSTVAWLPAATDVGFPASPLTALAVMASAGVLLSLVSATGEEIGWRGLLVPELAKITSFRNTSLISGAIWALYHAPLLIFADYNSGSTPLWFSLTCFTLMVFGLSFIMAWLRLSSGSLWPAALLHATHNLFVQGVFDTATLDRGFTRYVTTEFGIGIALTVALAAWLIARRPLPPSRIRPAAETAA